MLPLMTDLGHAFNPSDVIPNRVKAWYVPASNVQASNESTKENHTLRSYTSVW